MMEATATGCLGIKMVDAYPGIGHHQVSMATETFFL